MLARASRSFHHPSLGTLHQAFHSVTRLTRAFRKHGKCKPCCSQSVSCSTHSITRRSITATTRPSNHSSLLRNLRAFRSSQHPPNKSASVPFLPAPFENICERSVPPITLRKHLRSFRSSHHPPKNLRASRSFHHPSRGTLAFDAASHPLDPGPNSLDSLDHTQKQHLALTPPENLRECRSSHHPSKK